MSSTFLSHLYNSVPFFVKRQKDKDHAQLHKERVFYLNTINHLCGVLGLIWQTVKLPTVGPRCPLGPALPAIP